MIIADRIVVCCPGNRVTGGPELLHQLVHQLRILGHQAYIAYYPFDRQFNGPEAYRDYNAPQTPFFDSPGTFLIVPETATRFLKPLKHSEAAVWWLSVDNYFCARQQSRLDDLWMRYKTLLRRHRLPLRHLNRFAHFAQSQYAAEFLARAGIPSSPLTDYLGKAHLCRHDVSDIRGNIVVYNPEKGQKQTLKLLEAHSDIQFVPIYNMSSDQVARLFARTKLYMDFGHHPGKERLPREAAIAGCCVITGRQGSANFFNDLPIPDKFKLDDRGDGYLRNFRPIVDAIFNDFEIYSAFFEPYRTKIRTEPVIFGQQVEALFGRGKS